MKHIKLLILIIFFFLVIGGCASKGPPSDAVIQSIKGPVIVYAPQIVEARDSYRGITGPVWVWETIFEETSKMTGITITHRTTKVHAPDGSIWENIDPDTKRVIDKVEIKSLRINPGGSKSYKYFCYDLSHTMCNGICSLIFFGADDGGNPVVLPTMILLRHTNCPKRK